MLILEQMRFLYLDVSEYGVNYQIINSETKVSVSGKLVDLRTGTLWTGSATASSDEQNNNNSSGLIAALVVAAVKQITILLGMMVLILRLSQIINY